MFIIIFSVLSSLGMSKTTNKKKNTMKVLPGATLKEENLILPGAVLKDEYQSIEKKKKEVTKVQKMPWGAAIHKDEKTVYYLEK